VAEDHLSITCRDAKRLEQGCDGVPYVMNLDQADVLRLADPAEGPDEVPRLDRPSVRVVNTRSVSGHAEPISVRYRAWVTLWASSAWRASLSKGGFR
jgi:hypothetical protein